MQPEVSVEEFCRLTGYTKSNVNRKIRSKVWREGSHWISRANGVPLIVLAAYNRWVEGHEPDPLKVPASHHDENPQPPSLLSRLAAGMHIEAIPGVYWLIDRNNEVVYVGQSNDCKARLRGHAGKEFTRAQMTCFEDPIERSRFERELVGILNPKLNVLLRTDKK